MTTLNFSPINPSWRPLIDQALVDISPYYLKQLSEDDTWLPGHDKIFNAFSLPFDQCHYVLFGESPYPRCQSANGYAFWDGAVHEIWSSNGLSTAVNRATSLRNFIKMLLVADNALEIHDTSQQKIAAVDKSSYVHTLDELFANLLRQGFLLLNASLVLSNNSVTVDAKAWRPFMNNLLEQLCILKPSLKLVLFGNIAAQINHMAAAQCFEQHIAEHPYNVSFINNQKMHALFGPMELLKNPELPPEGKNLYHANLVNTTRKHHV